MINPEATCRLGHALQAIGAIERYIANAPLQESLSDDLTRNAVQRRATPAGHRAGSAADGVA
jgi:uncharacterized protein with HEPN domain